MEEVVCKMLVTLLDLSIVRGMKWQRSSEIHLKLTCPGPRSMRLLRFSLNYAVLKKWSKARKIKVVCKVFQCYAPSQWKARTTETEARLEKALRANVKTYTFVPVTLTAHHFLPSISQYFLCRKANLYECRAQKVLQERLKNHSHSLQIPQIQKSVCI